MDHDWSGGGFGKYRGLPLKDIQEHFDRCVEEPSMRSVSAVLRIAREQIESRGDLGKQPYYMAFFGVSGLAALLISILLPPELQRLFIMAAGGMLLATAAFGAGYLKTRTARKINLQQERAIRERAKAALEQILQTEFARKPLTREQVDTLRDILKQCGDSPALRLLL